MVLRLRSAKTMKKPWDMEVVLRAMHGTHDQEKEDKKEYINNTTSINLRFRFRFRFQVKV
jgi:hypothetical protein